MGECYPHNVICDADGYVQWCLCERLLRRNMKTVIRPALLYGAEIWSTTKIPENRLRVNEIRMLRWMCFCFAVRWRCVCCSLA